MMEGFFVPQKADTFWRTTGLRQTSLHMSSALWQPPAALLLSTAFDVSSLGDATDLDTLCLLALLFEGRGS